jgi:voltage-gated potassium channel
MKIRHILYWFLPTLIVVSTLGIHIIEYLVTGDPETEYGSLFNSFYWTIVTIATVGFGDMSPETYLGRVFAIFVIIGGVLNYSLIVSTLTTKFSEYRSSREKGLDPVKKQGHILVCSDDSAWMTKILGQNQQLVQERKIVIISPSSQHPLLTTEYKDVDWVAGDSQQLETLLKAGAKSAHTAYVYFKNSNQGLITVLQLETLSKGELITLAQYVGSDFRKFFADVGCDHALNPYDLYVPMMLQAFRSQGGPSWIRGVVHQSQEHQLETQPLPARFAEKTWMEYVQATKRLTGYMPLGIVMEEVVLINPSSEHILRRDSQVIQLQSAAERKGGDLEEHGIDVSGMDDIRIEGHLLINSDNPIFIRRMLRELSRSEMADHVVILTGQPKSEEIPENLSVEWIQDPNNSEEAFRKARASLAKVAFIDHLQDGQTLMAVLYLEQETDGEIFTIAIFRDDNFDQHLMKVGCDFCLKFDDLIVPILAQSANNSGLGNLVSQLLSHDLNTQSLFVRRLSYDWVTATWEETILQIKQEYGYLAVGLIRRGTSKLLVNPHSGQMVNSGDSLIFIAKESALRGQHLFDLNHTDQVVKRELTPKVLEQKEADEEHLTQQALKLLRQDGDANAAYRLLIQAATLGSAEAKYELGILNFRGKGIPKNLDEAYYWFRESALSGYEQSQNVLSTIRILRETEQKFEETEGRIPEFNPEMLEMFSPAQRRWFARMVVAVVQADGRVDLHERAFVHSAIQLLSDHDDILDLEEYVLHGKCPEVEPIELSKEVRDRVLDSLLNVATIDRHFDEAECELLRNIARSVGCDEQTVEQLLEIGNTRVQQFHSTQLHAPNVRARI